MQCACAILSSVTCPALQYFSPLSHKFSEKNVWNIKCLFWFSLQLCLKHVSFFEELSEMWSKILIGLHVKCPLFLSDFNETLNFLDWFRKHSNIKVRENPFSGSRVVSWGWTDGSDGQRVMTMLIVAFRNFANAPRSNLVHHTLRNTDLEVKVLYSW
jgi:hypothetical protein